MQLHRTIAVCLTAIGLLVACVENEGAAPSITELVTPAEVDVGTPAKVSIRVQGQPNEQLSIAFDASLGTFTPPQQVVITDSAGAAALDVTYLATTSGNEALLVSAATVAGASALETRAFRVHGITRLGFSSPNSEPLRSEAFTLVGISMPLTATRVVTKVGVLMPQQATSAAVPAELAIYHATSATSMTLVTKVTANLVAGPNEATVTPVSLAPGQYFAVIAYSGEPLVYRSIANISSIISSTHTYEAGLPSTLTDFSSNSIAARTLYWVVRD